MYGAEAVLEGYPSETLLLSGSVFTNQYQDTIGYQLVGVDQLATAYDAINFGAEVTGRLHQPIEDLGFVDAQVSVSLQNTITDTDAVAAADPFAIGGGKIFPDNESVPTAFSYERLGLVLESYRLAVTVEHRHVGQRTPSQSNLLQCTIPNMNDPCYQLPAFDLLDLSLSSVPIPLGDEISLRGLVKVSNLLDTEFIEVGFNGVDVPGLGRTLWVRLDLLL
ncbi:MAG TPA: TonB-dependent receptor [Deltaproteobacteria bacterium]|nr:TonB-dependent receptor [Deltaproteobacteria bacterium]